MKTQETTPGKTYSVHTSSGCTVSDKNGWSKTIDAPEGYFTAHAKEVTIDGDDAASVKELFKLAPAALVSGGGAASGEPEGDYVTLDTSGAITGGRLDTLENGDYLQCDKKTLTDWSIDLPSLVSGQYMFQSCSALTTFDVDLSSLKNGNSMFQLCSALTTFTADLSSLTNGSIMFSGCKALTTFDVDLPSLANGTSMFYGCPALTTFNSGLQSLSGGASMFSGCTSLTTFDVNLPTLIDGTSMFSGCTSLTTFDVDLPLLTKSLSMFSGCSKLTTFDVDLPLLMNGGYMFRNCTSLTTFNSSLQSLTNGQYMFNGCTSLTTFNSSLQSLTNGQYMFTNCQLNKESALRVLNSIPSYTSGSRSLTIGIHVDYKNDEEVGAAITAAETKRWTLTVQWNGTASAAAASTYGLRRQTIGLRRQPIFAKLGDPMEDGTPVLDWGHYVTDWEENGYQEFSSLEEAEEYFNINQTEEE